MSPTLAGPPSSCCFTHVKHSGTPVGRIEELGGMNTYIAEPAPEATGKRNKVILFLADIWGPFFINNKLLQDYFASFGFIVLGPDYLFGDTAANFVTLEGREEWILSLCDPAMKAFPRWFDAVKAVYGTDTTEYCAVGYCFGAPFVMDLAADGSVVAGAIAHPAFLEESHFENMNRPVLLSCAEDDPTFPLPSRRRAEDIMVEKKKTYYFQVFSGVSHGFAVRGDPSIDQQRKCIPFPPT